MKTNELLTRPLDTDRAEKRPGAGQGREPLDRKRMKTNRKKRQIILSGEHLAEIPSKLPPPSKANRLFWRFFIIFVVVVFSCVTISTKDKTLMWAGPAVGVILGVMLAYVSDWVFARSYPLAFTTRGITAGPYINELWEDLEFYRLYEVEGLRRHTISKIGTGTTLTLFNKGLWQRTIGKSGSVFPIQGYFFTEPQQAELRRIFMEHGVNEKT